MQISGERSVEGTVPGRGRRRALGRSNRPVFREYKGAVWLEGCKQRRVTQGNTRQKQRDRQGAASGPVSAVRHLEFILGAVEVVVGFRLNGDLVV